MKQLLWKELRENAKWALLALIVLFLACFYALSLTDERQDYQNSVTLCHSAFLIVTSFGFALVGAALGCLQILPELKRDQWAALLHRPLDRWKILLAKAAVGVLLYALATLLPLAACVIHVATPGNFPSPFVPGMVLPALSDWCVGLCFYALALLICLQSGRWWGLRGVLACAGAAIFAIHLLPRWPFSLPLLAFVIFMLAACGAIVSPRQFRLRPRLFRWASVAAVFLGCYSLLAFLVAGKAALNSGNYTTFLNEYTSYVVGPDGQLLLSKQSKSKNTLCDMAGEDVTAKYFANSGQPRLSYFDAIAFFAPGFDRGTYVDSTYSRFSRAYFQPVYLRGNEREAWYYLNETRVFVGYDKLTKQPIGLCDREGFKEPGSPIVSFPEGSYEVANNASPDSIFYYSNGQILRLHFGDRAVTPFLNIGQKKLNTFAVIGANEGKTSLYALSFADHFELLDLEGKSLLSLSYPRDTKVWNYLSLAADTAHDRFYLQCANSVFNQDLAPQKIYVYVYDFRGQILATYDRPPDPLPLVSPWTVAAQIAHIAISPPALLAAFLSPASPFPWVIQGGFPLGSVTLGQLAALLAGTLLLATLTFILARRQGRTARDATLWALFVFLLGLPALLTYRLASGWPVRSRCPQCGKNRDLSGVSCSTCSSAWPVMAKTGSELLEPLGTD